MTPGEAIKLLNDDEWHQIIKTDRLIIIFFITTVNGLIVTRDYFTTYHPEQFQHFLILHFIIFLITSLFIILLMWYNFINYERVVYLSQRGLSYVLNNGKTRFIPWENVKEIMRYKEGPYYLYSIVYRKNPRRGGYIMVAPMNYSAMVIIRTYARERANKFIPITGNKGPP